MRVYIVDAIGVLTLKATFVFESIGLDEGT
jgi:hypothetical protein